jgi:hypothetical protein
VPVLSANTFVKIEKVEFRLVERATEFSFLLCYRYGVRSRDPELM